MKYDTKNCWWEKKGDKYLCQMLIGEDVIQLPNHLINIFFANTHGLVSRSLDTNIFIQCTIPFPRVILSCYMLCTFTFCINLKGAAKKIVW